MDLTILHGVVIGAAIASIFIGLIRGREITFGAGLVATAILTSIPPF